ncbi:aminotransferase class V-fold PLP-dependent enzyme [Sulfuracidifex tepidarius]|uniref:Cysteine desulfurase n=1 Tax=Sulfuracidifex tepidarius TaxID=1294262 RepID=A0A510E6J6_9CREN|nr:aminotransferase class V-fold PLP-dependent enzyme [Sulfuracidifex tepidarius]BBG28106.1 Cysteine desulfurase [Sulfuracidifex tepidarius]
MKIDYREFRDLVPVTRKYKYLNHAAISPTPLPVIMESFSFMYDVSDEGTIAVNYAERDDLNYIREPVSRLVNSRVEEVSLVPNTSYGINMILHGIGLKEGDQILTDSSEFPAITSASFKLLKKGIKVKIAEVTPETFEDDIVSNLNDNVRLVAISSTSFLTGVTPDLSKVSKEAKSNNSLLLVDGIQTVGAGKIDVEENRIDFLVAGGYKWMMSPQGSGFMFVRKGLLEDPPWYGWRADSTYEEFSPYKFAPDKGPRRFEIGTYPMVSLIGMKKAAEIIYENSYMIYSRVKELSKVAIDCLKDKGMDVLTPEDKRTGIVTVKVRDPKKVVEELYKKYKIVVSPRGSGIRISTHFYNTEEEVNEACEYISTLEKELQ